MRAIILALFLASPAAAGGLAPAVSPVPPERPAYAPLMEPLPAKRCEHIPWTMCADGEPEGGSAGLPQRQPEAPPVAEPPAVVEKPSEPEKPDGGGGNGPCKGRTGPWKPGC